MNFIKNNQAFTLMQLVVTVSVILVLAATAIFGEDALSRKGKAKDVKRWYDVTALAEAVGLYQIDNSALPATIAAAVTIDTDEKYVLCSSADSIECDGQTRDCLVVDDADFLDGYLGGALPIDPDTPSSGTGYYITKKNSQQMAFGACDSYDGTSIEYLAKAKVPPICGNNVVEPGETCDDGNILNEGCGNGESLDTPSTEHCNSTCTAKITTTVTELCDYDSWSSNCRSGGVWYTITDLGGPSFCNITCDVEISSGTACDDVPPPLE